LICPTTNELNKILWGERCIGIRFFARAGCTDKCNYLVVSSEKKYDLALIDSRSRNQTRRGLENFQIEPIRFKELNRLYNDLDTDTLTRNWAKPSDMERKEK